MNCEWCLVDFYRPSVLSMCFLLGSDWSLPSLSKMDCSYFGFGLVLLVPWVYFNRLCRLERMFSSLRLFSHGFLFHSFIIKRFFAHIHFFQTLFTNWQVRNLDSWSQVVRAQGDRKQVRESGGTASNGMSGNSDFLDRPALSNCAFLFYFSLIFFPNFLFFFIWGLY